MFRTERQLRAMRFRCARMVSSLALALAPALGSPQVQPHHAAVRARAPDLAKPGGQEERHEAAVPVAGRVGVDGVRLERRRAMLARVRTKSGQREASTVLVLGLEEDPRAPFRDDVPERIEPCTRDGVEDGHPPVLAPAAPAPCRFRIRIAPYTTSSASRRPMR